MRQLWHGTRSLTMTNQTRFNVGYAIAAIFWCYDSVRVSVPTRSRRSPTATFNDCCTKQDRHRWRVRPLHTRIPERAATRRAKAFRYDQSRSAIRRRARQVWGPLHRPNREHVLARPVVVVMPTSCSWALVVFGRRSRNHKLRCGLMSIGKSKAKIYVEAIPASHSTTRGVDEAKTNCEKSWTS